MDDGSGGGPTGSEVIDSPRSATTPDLGHRISARDRCCRPGRPSNIQARSQQESWRRPDRHFSSSTIRGLPRPSRTTGRSQGDTSGRLVDRDHLAAKAGAGCHRHPRHVTVPVDSARLSVLSRISARAPARKSRAEVSYFLAFLCGEPRDACMGYEGRPTSVPVLARHIPSTR